MEKSAIVIDAHAHLVTPDSLYANGMVSLAAQGGHGRIGQQGGIEGHGNATG